MSLTHTAEVPSHHGHQTAREILGGQIGKLGGNLPSGKNKISVGVSLIPRSVLLILGMEPEVEHEAANLIPIIRKEASEILQEHGLIRWIRFTIRSVR